MPVQIDLSILDAWGTKHSLQLYSGHKGCPRQQHLLRGFSTRSRAFTMRISITTSSLSCTAHTKRVSSLWFLYAKAGQAITRPLVFLIKITMQFASGTDQIMWLRGIHFTGSFALTGGNLWTWHKEEQGMDQKRPDNNRFDETWKSFLGLMLQVCKL